MKKIVSLLLVTLMILSAFTLCFSSSAEAAGKDPTFSADKNLIVNKWSKWWGNSLDGASTQFDKNYAMAFQPTFNGKTIVKSSATGDQVNFDTKEIYTTFGMAKIGTTQKNITLNGALTNSTAIGYVYIYTFEVNSAATLNSFLISVPNDEIYGKMVPDGFSMFVADEPWNETSTYKVVLENPTTKTFTKIAEVKDLGSKWVVSADGSFKYYEANFATPVQNRYITYAFEYDDFKTIHDLKNSGEYKGAYASINELAVFADKIPTATDPGTNSSATNPTTGDSFTLMTVLSLGAVLTAAAVVVKVRKKED